ncbi:hypothetical protein [Anaerorhabdus furcosa]|uniref:Uncharacterized protein n=1 Tax=Anaerorhabdus furcosa TaxID=118967 RepID=A0A1T4MLV1_9FIRM|nr:hypothetical protein [Anaerorhabdus furcosa]SJZ67817.1 hypothetical protein SAMN02745191_1299 [Anaerorhabdus furcosa]
MTVDEKEYMGINPLVSNKMILNQIEGADENFFLEVSDLENHEEVVAICQNQFMRILVNESIKSKKDVTTCLEMIKIVVKGL